MFTLFIDFKEANDTITRNEIYVIMAELDFPTTNTSNQNNADNCCCVKIQKESSDFFETLKGIRQGNVLSTLLFNVVLKVIVLRAKLQTADTSFNKQTQLIAYANDIDIVSRNSKSKAED
jgi:hypothetical protein